MNIQSIEDKVRRLGGMKYWSKKSRSLFLLTLPVSGPIYVVLYFTFVFYSLLIKPVIKFAQTDGNKFTASANF